jgi:cell division septation protein DedD
MSRIDYLTVGLVALCMAALIYLVYRYVNLGKQPTKPSVEQVDPPQPAPSEPVDTPSNTSGVAPKIDSSKLNIEQPAPSNSTPTTSVEEDKAKPSIADKTGKTDPSGANAAQTPPPAPTPPAPKSEPKPTPPPPAPTSKPASAPGKYMVIAGSYKEIRFAKEMLAKIRKMGYRKAQIEKFNRGAYATILVDRFYSEKPARKMVADLKFNAVDAMMLVKK